LVAPLTSAAFGGGLEKPLVSLGLPGENNKPVAETFFQKKRREEIERMEQEVNLERAKINKMEADHQKRMEDMRTKNKNDFESIEAA